jgi:hypothetical protein
MTFLQQIFGGHKSAFHIVDLHTIQVGMWIFNEDSRQPMLDQAVYLCLGHRQRKNNESIQVSGQRQAG